MRRYIDEYFELENKTNLTPNFGEIKLIILNLHKEGKSINDIVKHLQEILYIFTDEDETLWEAKIVKNIIEGKPVINRMTKVQFN